MEELYCVNSVTWKLFPLFHRNPQLSHVYIEYSSIILLRWNTRGGSCHLNFLHHVHSIQNLTEYHMLAIQPRSWRLMIIQFDIMYSRNKELWSIRIRARIGHGQQAWLRMLQTECLIRECVTVDALAPLTVSLDNVTSLNHESRNNSVERSSLVMQRLSVFANSLLACT